MDDREAIDKKTDIRRIIETLNWAEIFQVRLHEDSVEINVMWC